MRCLRSITNLWSNIMPRIWRRAFLKPAAFAVGSVVLAVILWGLLRPPLRQLWSMLDLASIIHPKPVLQTSPLLVCTGVDSQGVPQGVSDSFTRDQIAQSIVMVFLAYVQAVPQKTTYQIRWKSGDRMYESAVHSFERAADVLLLHPDKDLPAGNYTVEFLVDGVVQRSASVAIQPSSEDETVRVVPRRKPRRSPAARVNTPPPVEAGNVIPPSGAPPAAPVPQPNEPVYQMELQPLKPTIEPTTAGPSKESQPASARIYAARHKHLLGSCSGELTLTPDSIEFASQQHYFKYYIDKVVTEGDGVQDRDWKVWHLEIPGENVGELLRSWKNGQLFQRR